MKDNVINTDRLLLLAEHLRRRRQFERIDDFGSLPAIRMHENGCVMRHFDFPFFECVHIFNEWAFNSDGLPVLCETSQSTIADSAMDYFNLDNELFQHLFSPLSQDCERYGGRILDRDASRRDIASNIECFIEKQNVELIKIAA